jgi:mannose-6-phosphate isomerase-like protein (cupin superfamily)
MGEVSWHVGNALGEGQEHRGWIVGHFIDDGDIRRSEDVEIKWGVHPKGDERAEWQGDEYRTTVLLLVKGRFRIELDEDSSVLQHQGDYAMWGPGVGHSWRAEEDSVVLTVRWPSGGK